MTVTLDTADGLCPATGRPHAWKASSLEYRAYFCDDCKNTITMSTPSVPTSIWKPPPPRPSWPETWMTVARTMAQRSYDPRLKVGAIVVSCDNTQMLSVGFNGNYKGGPHQHESAEPGQSGFIHAEVNALVKCDFNFGKQKHMYVTHSPCRACAKLIINAEISRVVYDVQYRDISPVDLLRSAGVEVFSFLDAVAAS